MKSSLRFVTRSLLVGTLLGTLTLAAQAAWVDVGALGDKRQVQLDGERFQRQGEAVTAIIRVSYPTTQRIPFSPKTYETTETTYFFDCTKKLFIAANGKMFDKGGEAVYEFDAMKSPFGAPKAEVVADGSLESLALTAACKFKK